MDLHNLNRPEITPLGVLMPKEEPADVSEFLDPDIVQPARVRVVHGERDYWVEERTDPHGDWVHIYVWAKMKLERPGSYVDRSGASFSTKWGATRAAKKYLRWLDKQKGRRDVVWKR